MLSDHSLDIAYHLRSCDLVHHFRDDIYLTIRLALWMLDRLRERDLSTWSSIGPGTFAMHIANLHCFVNDFHGLKEGK
jgi:hypothetical protein